jgi:hypothetical protein
MIGVQRVTKIYRQNRPAIYVLHLIETNETARLKMRPPRNFVAYNIRVAAIGTDNDFLLHGWSSSRLFMLLISVSLVLAEFLACHPSYGRFQW